MNISKQKIKEIKMLDSTKKTYGPLLERTTGSWWIPNNKNVNGLDFIIDQILDLSGYDGVEYLEEDWKLNLNETILSLTDEQIKELCSDIKDVEEGFRFDLMMFDSLDKKYDFNSYENITCKMRKIYENKRIELIKTKLPIFKDKTFEELYSYYD